MYEKFRKLLELHDLKTSTVARETGIASSTFSDWKKGRYEPKADKLQKLAEYFDVPVAYFFTDEIVVEAIDEHNASIDDDADLLLTMLNGDKFRNFVVEAYQLEDAELDELIRFMEFIKGKRDGNERND